VPVAFLTALRLLDALGADLHELIQAAAALDAEAERRAGRESKEMPDVSARAGRHSRAEQHVPEASEVRPAAVAKREVERREVERRQVDQREVGQRGTD
jgi:hypothetical protein